ncbi:MAG: hypothetical protein K8U57_15015 [Planctomycetes bacterium]|nr:hypothetical protein [Planctomycetota bacterium]
MLRSWQAIAGVVLLAVILVSCGGAGGPSQQRGSPPVPKLPITTAFRNSLVGKGMVLVIRNDSADQTLPSLGVVVRSAKRGDNSELNRQVAQDVKPGQVVEVGWAELSGWRLEPGESVDIWCVGGREYERLTLRVPAKPSN